MLDAPERLEDTGTLELLQKRGWVRSARHLYTDAGARLTVSKATRRDEKRARPASRQKGSKASKATRGKGMKASQAPRRKENKVSKAMRRS